MCMSMSIASLSVACVVCRVCVRFEIAWRICEHVRACVCVCVCFVCVCAVYVYEYEYASLCVCVCVCVYTLAAAPFFHTRERI
jgi:hypothetical protein